MNNLQFEEQHSVSGNTTIMSPGPTADNSRDIAHVHWSVTDLILLAISSIAAFVGILVVFTLVLMSIYGREHLQDIALSPTYSVGSAVIEVVAFSVCSQPSPTSAANRSGPR